MDKLKENLFAVALGGVCLVLLVLAFFLVYQPWMSLGERVGEVQALDQKLGRYERASPLPTSQVHEAYVARKDRAESDLQSAVSFYDTRAKAFQLYFGNAEQVLDQGQFYSQIADEAKTLLDTYRTNFSIQLPESSSQNAKLAPEVTGIPLEPGDPDATRENISATMKRYWMLDAIVDAATALDIGGLRVIEFGTEKAGRRRSSGASGASGEEGAKKPPYVVDHVDVTVKASMKVDQISSFLERLFTHEVVPFVAATRMTYDKPQERLEKHKLLEIVLVEDPDAVSTPVAELIEEPLVDVELDLRALDWRGAPADTAGGLWPAN